MFCRYGQEAIFQLPTIAIIDMGLTYRCHRQVPDHDALFFLNGTLSYSGPRLGAQINRYITPL